jgi:hypothetical protein
MIVVTGVSAIVVTTGVDLGVVAMVFLVVHRWNLSSSDVKRDTDVETPLPSARPFHV